MLKGLFNALSSKVFGSGQSEPKSSNEDGGGNSSNNALKEKTDQTSVDAAVVSSESTVQKKESLKEDTIVPQPDEKNNINNSGSEVTVEEQSASVVYTKNKNDALCPESSVVENKEQDQEKGKMADTQSKVTSSAKSGDKAQDMSEWVTLEMPKDKRSPRNRKSRSPKNQDTESSLTSEAVSEPRNDQKTLLDSGDIVTETLSSDSALDTTAPNSKLEKKEKGAKGGGDGKEIKENNSCHLDEDSFSSLLVSSMLEEIVGQMSEVTVKDTMKDSRTEDTNQNANQDHAYAVKPQDDNWRAKRPNNRGEEYCREKPQRGKKGMNRRGHKQGYNDDCLPTRGKHEEGKETIEDTKKSPPIDPNLEQEDFLQFTKMCTERDKLIRAKKLIYKLGYLKDVPQDEIKDVILGQYKIAARCSVHGWIEDARYYAEVMISRDWIDDNLLYLNPRMNKKSSNKRNKNRYMEKEDSFARKTGGLCQDVRLLTNPNLTVVRVNMKSSGQVETIKGDNETSGDKESKEVDSGGEKLTKTGEEDRNKDGLDKDKKEEVEKEKKEMDKEVESKDKEEEDKDKKKKVDKDKKEKVGKDKKEKVGKDKKEVDKEVDSKDNKEVEKETMEVEKEEIEKEKMDKDKEVTAEADKDDEDQFEDCSEEPLKDSRKALEEVEETVQQVEVTEVLALMEECVITQQEISKNIEGDVQNQERVLKEDHESEKQSEELVTSNDSFTDPAIIMMVKSSDTLEDLPEQPSCCMEMSTYDPKCDVLSGLFKIEEDPRSLIETIMHSDSPTEPSVTRDNPQEVMLSRDDPSMVVENDSQLIDYLLTVSEEPKTPVTMFPEISCISGNFESLTELEGIDDFLTDMVTSKIGNDDVITDIDTAGIGDGGFGEEVVNLDLVKDESVMKMIQQCRTEDLAEGESCEGAGEAPALEGHVLEEGEAKESIQHFGDPVASEMVCNLLQDLPILHPETGNTSLKQDCVELSADPDCQRTGDLAGDNEEAFVGEITKDTTANSSHQGTTKQTESELVESQTNEEPYSPTQKCVESYSPAKNVESSSPTKSLTEPSSTSLDE